MKVEMLTPFNGDVNLKKGDSHEFPDGEVIDLVESGLAEPVDQKSYEKLLEKSKESKAQLEEKEQKAAAILHKEELEEKRAHHQREIDEITHALGDGAIYYKSYADLAADLQKKESTDNENSNDGKNDNLPQGPGDE